MYIMLCINDVSKEIRVERIQKRQEHCLIFLYFINGKQQRNNKCW